MMEEWREIPNVPGYLASSDGNIRNIKTGTIRRPRLKKSGYFCVKIRQKHLLVHRLIAKAFIDNPLFKREVNHKNRNRLDNRVYNLEWCTPSENVKHSFDSGRVPKPTTLGKKGKLCAASKPVIALSGPSVMELDTKGELAKILKTRISTLNRFIDSGIEFKGFIIHSA